MEMTKGKGSRTLAGVKRNPSRDTNKTLKQIIPHKRRRRYVIRFTREFWEGIAFMVFLASLPVLYMALQMLGEVIW